MRSASAVDPDRSQNTEVASFRRSGAGAAREAAQLLQNRAPAGFSAPQAEQIAIPGELVLIRARIAAVHERRAGDVPLLLVELEGSGDGRLGLGLAAAGSMHVCGGAPDAGATVEQVGLVGLLESLQHEQRGLVVAPLMRGDPGPAGQS